MFLLGQTASFSINVVEYFFLKEKINKPFFGQKNNKLRNKIIVRPDIMIKV